MCATSGSSQFSIQSFLFKLCFNFALALLPILSKFRWERRCKHSTRKTAITTMNSHHWCQANQTIYSVSCCWVFHSESQPDMLVRVVRILQWCVWGCPVCWHFAPRYWVMDARRFGIVLWSSLRQSNVQWWLLKINHTTVQKFGQHSPSDSPRYPRWTKISDIKKGYRPGVVQRVAGS